MLLDTYAVLWLMDDSPRFGPSTRAAINNSSAVLCSAASFWELTIKQQKGTLDLPDDFIDAILAAGLQELSISGAHVAALGHEVLPHRDPFDHMLVAQARVERLNLVTADQILLDAGLPFVVDARE